MSILLGGVAVAEVTPAQKCWSGRANAGAKYLQCIGKAVAMSYRGSVALLSPALFKCVTKYAATWPKLQLLSGTACDVARWVDNGDGTVTDNLTTLVWEQKTDDATIHDWDDTYWWSDLLDGDKTDEDGPVFTVFLPALNAAGGFAGANGWRLPTLAELYSIVVAQPATPHHRPGLRTDEGGQLLDVFD